MILRADIDVIESIPQKKLWIPENISRLVKNFERLPFWKTKKYLTALGTNEYDEISDLEEMVEQMSEWESGDYQITSEKNINAGNAILLTLHSDCRLAVSIGIAGNYLEPQSSLTDFIEILKGLHRSLMHVAIMGPRIDIRVLNVAFYRNRPPFRDRVFYQNTVIDLISLPFLEQHDRLDRRMGNFQKLLKEELPDKVVREEQDGLVLIKWVEDLSSEDQVSKSLTARNRWMSENLDLKIAGEFNDQGDLCDPDISLNLPRSPYLTFYHEYQQIGYKSVVLDTVHPEEMRIPENLIRWSKEGMTPEGLILKELNLITNTRESAIALYQPAVEAGMGKVLYIGEDQLFWNPNPPGLWLN